VASSRGLTFSLTDVAFTIAPDGIEEFPGLGAPFLHPKHGILWVDATPAVLGSELDTMAASFLERFETPANSLPVDGGEYVWIVDEWSTEEALDEVFAELETSVREAAASYLDGISTEWVRVAD
jgi:hypothetical protein